MKTNLENYAEEMSRNIKSSGLECFHWSEVALVIDELLKYSDLNNPSKKNDLCFIGFTNGLQISYGLDNGGEGAFYSDCENKCHIPVYMLKAHTHRIETTSDGIVTAKDLGLDT